MIAKLREEQGIPFHISVAVSPFKYAREDCLYQYLKLEKKVAAGANFAITQVGWDARKFAELKRYLDERGVDLPVLGNVLRAGPARGRENGRRFAAGMLGFPGARRTGPQGIRGRRTAGWKRGSSAPRRQWPFSKGSATRAPTSAGPTTPSSWCGSSPAPGARAALAGVRGRTSVRPRRRFLRLRLPAPATAAAADGVARTGRPGKLMPVTRDTWLRRRLESLSAWVDRRPLLAKLTERFEYAIKRPVFGCQACGNCVLGHMEYVCPQTCPKQMRNGPCGGTLLHALRGDRSGVHLGVGLSARRGRQRVAGAEDVHSGARSVAAGHELVDQLFSGPRQPPGGDASKARRSSNACRRADRRPASHEKMLRFWSR